MREQAPAALLPHDLGDSSSGSAASAASFDFDPKPTLSRPLPQSTISIARYAVSATRLTPTSTTEPKAVAILRPAKALMSAFYPKQTLG